MLVEEQEEEETFFSTVVGAGRQMNRVIKDSHYYLRLQQRRRWLEEILLTIIMRDTYNNLIQRRPLNDCSPRRRHLLIEVKAQKAHRLNNIEYIKSTESQLTDLTMSQITA